MEISLQSDLRQSMVDRISADEIREYQEEEATSRTRIEAASLVTDQEKFHQRVSSSIKTMEEASTGTEVAKQAQPVETIDAQHRPTWTEKGTRATTTTRPTIKAEDSEISASIWMNTPPITLAPQAPKAMFAHPHLMECHLHQ